MTKQQIVILTTILFLGYAVFAIGGYLIGANATEQRWQGKVNYIAYAEERICHIRARIASDTGAFLAVGRLDEAVCGNFRESEGTLGAQAIAWENTVPPDEWRSWHIDVLGAMETIHQGYEHMTTACDYYDAWEFGNSEAELGLALGRIEPAAKTLDPARRPWAQ